MERRGSRGTDCHAMLERERADDKHQERNCRTDKKRAAQSICLSREGRGVWLQRAEETSLQGQCS